MSTNELHIFGIRHHGPGSARSLESALEKLQPTKILIEGPPEATELIPFAGQPGMIPPVALLVYASQDPSHASFYPFAVYSPEWRAMVWANANNIPAEFIDLPCAHRLAKDIEQNKRIDSEDEEEFTEEISEDTSQNSDMTEDMRQDPFCRLAQFSGYDDAEAWWNDVIEERHEQGNHFNAIEQAVEVLRDKTTETEETLQREAYMRLQINKILKDAEGPIAVVTGAWHAPALREKRKITEDRQLLKALPKTKTEATWVPWSDRHLATASGYGAGVLSPGWYDFLWKFGTDTKALSAKWQARVAQLMRDEGIPTSTASVIEATRLATSLAALRLRPTPGLTEMHDASLAVICGGDKMPLMLVRDKLVVGSAVGQVAETVPQPPLQADLSKLQKKLRLKPETDNKEISLDLRTPPGIAKSVLFNRLRLLDIPWGEFSRASGRGTFRENWVLAWDPVFSLRLNEAIRFGPTIEGAAHGAAKEAIEHAQTIADASTLIERCLLSDLPQAAELAMAKLQSISVQGNQISYLIEGVIPLVSILRYGTARPIPKETLKTLTLEMMREILIGLPYATQNLDETEAESMRGKLADLQQAFTLLEEQSLSEQFYSVLGVLLSSDTTNPGIRGLAARFLYDQNHLQAEKLHTLLVSALSYGTSPIDGAQWIEGFLSGTAEIIILDDTLFSIMDDWLMSLEEENFLETIPLIRRAFSNFDASQRHRLLNKIRSSDGQKDTHPTSNSYSIDDEQGAEYFAKSLPLLMTILDLQHE